MSLPPVIGLTGYARSGKNTAADILTELAGYEQLSLAAPLKSMALAIDPFVSAVVLKGRAIPVRLSTIVKATGWEKAKSVREVRRFLQRLGTEGVRNHLGDDAWIRAMRAAAEPILDKGGRVVITDVRFPNEAEAIKEMGGEVFRVVRDRAGIGTRHASESGVDAIDPDQVIDNNGTATDLRERLLAALEGVSA